MLQALAYVIKRLLTMRSWQSSCVIANYARKTQKLFVQGYNLEVHIVIKYTGKHRATVTNYITCKPGFCVT